jgi:hypothetical protein
MGEQEMQFVGNIFLRDFGAMMTYAIREGDVFLDLGAELAGRQKEHH